MTRTMMILRKLMLEAIIFSHNISGTSSRSSLSWFATSWVTFLVALLFSYSPNTQKDLMKFEPLSMVVMTIFSQISYDEWVFFSVPAITSNIWLSCNCLHAGPTEHLPKLLGSSHYSVTPVKLLFCTPAIKCCGYVPGLHHCFFHILLHCRLGSINLELHSGLRYDSTVWLQILDKALECWLLNKHKGLATLN